MTYVDPLIHTYHGKDEYEHPAALKNAINAGTCFDKATIEANLVRFFHDHEDQSELSGIGFEDSYGRYLVIRFEDNGFPYFTPAPKPRSLLQSLATRLQHPSRGRHHAL